MADVLFLVHTFTFYAHLYTHITTTTNTTAPTMARWILTVLYKHQYHDPPLGACCSSLLEKDGPRFTMSHISSSRMSSFVHVSMPVKSPAKAGVARAPIPHREALQWTSRHGSFRQCTISLSHCQTQISYTKPSQTGDAQGENYWLLTLPH